MTQKRLSVAKTHKKIEKLRKQRNELNETIKTIGRNTEVRGKLLENMDLNYILYNITMFNLMLKEAENIFKPSSETYDALINESVGEDIKDTIKIMKDYITLSLRYDQLCARLEKLEIYMDHLPADEKKAFRLERAAENIDARDLVDDEA